MSHSKLIAYRFATDLSGLALGMWEAARLLSKKRTKDEGLEKVKYLRELFHTYAAETSLRESLSIYLNKEFDPHVYASILDRLEQEELEDIIPKIRSLVEQTQGYLDESSRTGSDFRRPL